MLSAKEIPDAYKKIFNNLNIPIAFADENRKLVWSSQRFLELLEGDISGSDIAWLFKIEPAELEQKEFYTSENLFWEVRITPLASNDSSGYVVFLQEKSEASDKITARIKSIKNFAHDLNNILTSIANSSSLLSGSINPDENTKELLANIENNSQRASDIIQQVLSDSSSNESIKKKVILKNLLNELHNSLINIVRNEISIEFNVSDDLASITANYSDIYRVLLNLCINSSEAIKRKGKITLAAANITRDEVPENVKTYAESYVKISVADNGSGIRKKNIDKIFNKNFSTKTRDRESGLGLNIVKSIIHEHSGYIGVKSRWLIGTEFTIYLPAREMFQKSELSATSEKTILLADDEESILELLTDLLESYNYKVIKAVNGTEVLKAYRRFPNVDLMIIDRKMPELDGIDCIIKLRNSDYMNPIILTSGSGSINTQINMEKLSVQKIMTKPYDFVELLEEVKLLLN